MGKNKHYTAWFVSKPNGPFEERVVSHGELMGNQVLVRIHASGVNPLDTKIRAGKAGHAKQPLPAVLGLDMAGVVEATAPGVAGFKPGDEVFGLVGGVGGQRGTLAEKVVADSDLLAHKPGNLTMRQAAALPLSVITAWEGLVDRAGVRTGHTVLIHAGAGGVGYAAVQIAVARGAKVYATVSPEKEGIVSAAGAIPIDYRSESVEEYVSRVTEGDGFDIVYDTVGGPTLDASFEAVRRYTGHVLSCLGWDSHSLAPLSFRGATYSGVFTLLPLLTGEGRSHHGQILEKAASLAVEQKLIPLLTDEKYSVANIEEAYRRVEGGSLGKVVIDIPGDR